MKEFCEQIGEEHDIIECPNCNCEFCSFCDDFEKRRDSKQGGKQES